MEQKLLLALFFLVGLTTNWASANRRSRRCDEFQNSAAVIGNKLDQLETRLDSINQRLFSIPATMDCAFQTGMNSILQKIDQQCVVSPQMNDRLIREPDDYLMVFRLTAGIGKSAYNRYVKVGNNDDENDRSFSLVPCGCKTNNGSKFCDRHYRSELLNMWSDLPIEKVKVSVHSKGVTKMSMVFNGEGSTNTNFFKQSRLLEDSYTDLSATKPRPNFFSIAGDKRPYLLRRFFISSNYGGCPRDAGWLVVGDGAGKNCQWEKDIPYYPFIIYAKSAEPYKKTVWQKKLYGIADVLTVSIKLKGDLC